MITGCCSFMENYIVFKKCSHVSGDDSNAVERDAKFHAKDI